MWHAVADWLKTYESLAIWAEGIALVAIFFLDWREYRRQGKERADQHRETADQMAIMQSQADAAKANADAAKDSADALVNSERAWVLVETAKIRPVYYQTSVISPVVKNFGKTIARILRVCTGFSLVQLTEELPPLPTYGSPQELNFILYPNREFQPIAIPIRDENIQSAKDGLLVLYVYGFLEYIDLAGAPKTTGFCLIYSQEKDGVTEGFYPFVRALPSYSYYT